MLQLSGRITHQAHFTAIFHTSFTVSTPDSRLSIGITNIYETRRQPVFLHSFQLSCHPRLILSGLRYNPLKMSFPQEAGDQFTQNFVFVCICVFTVVNVILLTALKNSSPCPVPCEMRLSLKPWDCFWQNICEWHHRMSATSMRTTGFRKQNQLKQLQILYCLHYFY